MRNHSRKSFLSTVFSPCQAVHQSCGNETSWLWPCVRLRVVGPLPSFHTYPIILGHIFCQVSLRHVRITGSAPKQYQPTLVVLLVAVHFCKPGPNVRFQLLSMKSMLSMPLVFMERSGKGVLKWGDRSFTNVGQIWTICQTLSCLGWQWLRHRITPGQSPVRYTHSGTGRQAVRLSLA